MKIVVSCVDRFEQVCSEGAARLKANGWDLVDNRLGYPYNFKHYSLELAKAMVVIAGIEKWTSERMDLAPHLKMIVRFGTGIDNIDSSAASKRGIIIARVLDGNTNAVAEQAITLMYALLKKVPELDKKTKSGLWFRPMCSELSGKTIGFLGFGKIPRRIAYKLQTSDVHMIAYDTSPDEMVAAGLNVQLSSFEHVLAVSDIISIHLPLNSQTEMMLDARTLSLLKPGSYLINTARGKIIDQSVLLDLIERGHIAGAGLDVFFEQPLPVDSEFLAMDNVICSPYISSRTKESMKRTGLGVVQHILSL
ncbi:MAG: phosphoglycerate dehydrogenase [Sphaerochaeta sp.]|nr:phosphoglycerate dehydrogenase [Sphaerochaeta sp.]